ncbi:hypothetical protein DYB32_010613 [Aphanomyces invadans]|uniref:DDE-1 domain-containing protein n=1 Tax=Aphanomyces invadans TaxID=157072 RepID=A0A3R6VDL0_9STRA|nr:hypothetical protein DYB32_010613 [Aphanomyces invadans]
MLLQTRAREVANDLGLTESQFRAGSTWVKSFLNWWSLSMRSKTRAGQSSAEEGEAMLTQFADKIRRIVDTNGIELIYNADQTGVNYEYIPKKTIDATGTKTVWVKGSGHEKDHLTAMQLADSNGVKYPLFLVLKTAASKVKDVVQDNLKNGNGFGVHVWEDIEELHERHPSRIYGNPTAWWNGPISLQFLTYHFGNRRGVSCKPVLLLWDDFSAHVTEEVLTLANELNVILEKIPPKFTRICQPADVAWMRPLKSALRHRWIEYLRTELQSHTSGPFKLFPPNRFDLVEWVNTA